MKPDSSEDSVVMANLQGAQLAKSFRSADGILSGLGARRCFGRGAACDPGNHAPQEIRLRILEIRDRGEVRSDRAFWPVPTENMVVDDHHQLLAVSLDLVLMSVPNRRDYGFVGRVAKQAVQKCPEWARQIVRSYYVQPWAVPLYWPGSKTHF